MNRLQRFRHASTVKESDPVGAGCMLVAVGIGALGALLGRRHPVLAGFCALPLLGVAWPAARYLALLLRARRMSVRAIVVTSSSPLWAAHIETRWLRDLPPDILALNYSDRHDAHGPARFGWAAHRLFLGTDREFCPAVIAFRGLRHPTIFRFFAAFKQFRQGRPEALHVLEARLLPLLRKGTV